MADKKDVFVKFTRKNCVDYENFESNTDFVPGKEISIAECVRNNAAPPEAANLEYDSDENGENVSFEDARPIIPDKIAALEALQSLEAQYQKAKSDKVAADAAAAEAQKLASVVGNPGVIPPGDSAGNSQPSA